MSSSDRGLFPLRRWHNRGYNIFLIDGGRYQGKIFDEYRRVYCITNPVDTVDTAIKIARAACELIAKGMCVPSGMGIIVDEGKAIREKEQAEHRAFQKSQRAKLRRK